jgi:multiple sugar transport system substrate-binding protein
MKKVFILIFLVFFTISATLIAEGQKESGSEGEEKVLNVWNVSPIESDPGTRVIGDIFEEKNPGVTVKYTGIPYSDKLAKSSSEFFSGAKHTSFDVDEVTEMWLPTFVNNEWLEPIDDYVDKSFVDRYPEGITKALKFDGKLYAIPHYINQPLFYYNEKMLKEAGYDRPPETWQELMEYSEKLTTGDQFGFAAPLYQESDTLYYLMSYVYQAGGMMYDENNEPAFNSPETLEAFNFLIDLYQNGYMPKGVTSMDCFRVANLFRQEKVAMMINWAFEIQNNLKEESKVKDDFKVSSNPAGAAGSKICAAPWLYVLSNKAKEKDLGIQYLEMFMTPELLSDYVLTEPGKIIPLTDIYYNERVENEVPFHEVIRDNIDNFVLETGPKKEELAIILVTELNKALIGEKSAEQALSDAENEANSVLE